MFKFVLFLFLLILVSYRFRCRASLGADVKGLRRVLYHDLQNCHPHLCGTFAIIVHPLQRNPPHLEVPIPGVLITTVELDEDVMVHLEFWRRSRLRGYERIPIEFAVHGCSEVRRFFGVQWKNLFGFRSVNCPIPPGSYRINERAFDTVLKNRDDCILPPDVLYAPYRIRGIFRNRTTFDDIYGCIYGDVEFKPVYRSQVRRFDIAV